MKQRLREKKKSAVYESDSEADDDEDDTACPNNNEEEMNTAPQANNNEREESSSIPTVTNANQPKAIINENTWPSILLELDDHNIGKCFAIYWPKPKAYYWGKLLHVFSNDDDTPAEEVEIQFLKKVETSTDPSRIKWDWPGKEDKGIVDAKLCFLGPCVPNISDTSRAKSFMQFSLEKDTLENFHRICKHGL